MRRPLNVNASLLRILTAAIFLFLRPAAFALGPGISGGGNLIPDPLPTVEEVKIAIQEARRSLPFVLNAIEAEVVRIKAGRNIGSHAVFGTFLSQFPRSFIQTLFPWPSPKMNIQDRLLKIKIKVNETRPCVDGLGSHKAASAIPFENDEICFSIPEIRKHSTRTNIKKRVVALLAHEVMHKQGIHEEAPIQKMEQFIERNLPDDPLKLVLFNFSNTNADGSQTQGTLLSLIKKSSEAAIAELAGSQDWGLTCLRIGLISGLIQGLDGVMELKPFLLQINRPSSLAEIKALKLRGSFLPFYCHNFSTAEAKALDDFFQSRDVYSFKTQENADPVLSTIKGYLQRPQLQNSKRLENELQEALRSIKNLELMYQFQRDHHLVNSIELERVAH